MGWSLMPVSLNWQLEIRGTVTGTGTAWWTDRSRGRTVGGLGVPPPKTADTDLHGEDGAYGADEFMSTRILTWPYACDADDFPALCALWEPVEDNGDITITIQVPGWGVRELTGRPGPLVDDWSEAFGAAVDRPLRVHALATFRALSPRLVVP